MTHVGVLRAALLSVVATCGIGMLSSVHAGKPAPPPPPPPPTPPDPTTIYEWREELGGWLDTSRNLIWGYMPTSFEGTNASYQWALDSAQTRYADFFYDTAESFQAKAVYSNTKYLEELALAADAAAIGDTADEQYHLTRAQGYKDFRDGYLADIPEFLDAGDIASLYDNWRLPTKDEASDAMYKGLFRYGSGGLNRYDCNPAVGNQEIGRNWLTVTSTATTNNRSAWAYVPGDETMKTVSMTQWCDFIVVRSYVPPVP